MVIKDELSIQPRGGSHADDVPKTYTQIMDKYINFDGATGNAASAVEQSRGKETPS